MEQWHTKIDLLVREFHQSATKVLTEIQSDCKQRKMDLSIDFINIFYNLLTEKFNLICGDFKWKWKVEIENQNLMRTLACENNNSLPSFYGVASSFGNSLMHTTPTTPIGHATLCGIDLNATPLNISQLNTTPLNMSPSNGTLVNVGTPSIMRTSPFNVGTPLMNSTATNTNPAQNVIPDEMLASTSQDIVSCSSTRSSSRLSADNFDAAQEENSSPSKKATKRKRSPPPREAKQRKVKAPGQPPGRKPKNDPKKTKSEDLDVITTTENLENMSPLNRLTYYCAHCRCKSEDSQSFDSIEKVYEHWQNRHSGENNFKPFRYQAVDMIECFHCDYVGEYSSVKKHFDENHPTSQFAVVALYDGEKCGLCPFVGRLNMLDHFGDRHKDDINVNDPAIMTDQCLAELLEFNFNIRYQCSGCARCFDSEYVVNAHIERSHPDSEVYVKKLQCDSIKAIVMPCCSDDEMQPQSLLKHIQSHARNYDCPLCNFSAPRMNAIDTHYKKEHVTAPPMNFAQYVKQILTADYLASKVIFGTGLVVTKRNLQNTQYDDSLDFDEFLQNFLYVKRELMTDHDDDKLDPNPMVLYRYQK